MKDTMYNICTTAFLMFLSLFDLSFVILIFLQIIDLVTGLIANKMDYKKSELYKGICKKIYTILLVTVCLVLSKYIHFKELKTLITFYYICYETLSIIENGDKLNVKYPKFLKNFFKSKISEVDNNEKKES